jgi:hypothetical protein
MSSSTPQQQSDNKSSPIMKEMPDRLSKDASALHTQPSSVSSLTPEQLSSLKEKQAGGSSLLPDEEVEISREDVVRQSLLHLQQSRPEEAASFASMISALKAVLPTNCAAQSEGFMVQDVCECAVDEDMAGACNQQVRRVATP